MQVVTLLRPSASGDENLFASMTFEQVVLLLTLLGGAIYITFEISWTIFNNKKK